MKNRDRESFLITGYIDGELSEQEKEQVEKLLKESESFRQQYESEKELKKLLLTKLKSAEAPAYLKARIERKIARGEARPSFWELVQSLFDYRPVATSFATAMLVFLLLLPAYNIITERFAGNTYTKSSVHNAQLQGEIICLDCDLFAKHSGTTAQHTILHRPGLKSDDGRIWTILQDDKSQRNPYGRDLLRKKVVLSGILFEDAHYISVSDYKLL